MASGRTRAWGDTPFSGGCIFIIFGNFGHFQAPARACGLDQRDSMLGVPIQADQIPRCTAGVDMSLAGVPVACVHEKWEGKEAAAGLWTVDWEVDPLLSTAVCCPPNGVQSKR